MYTNIHRSFIHEMFKWTGANYLWQYISAYWVTSPLCHSASVSLCHCVTPSLCRSAIVSLRHCVTLPLCHCAIVSLCHWVTPPLSHSAIVSLCHWVTPPLSHSAIESLRHCVTLPLCHFAIESLRHCVTLPLCHSTIVSLCHCVILPLSTLPWHHSAWPLGMLQIVLLIAKNVVGSLALQLVVNPRNVEVQADLEVNNPLSQDAEVRNAHGVLLIMLLCNRISWGVAVADYISTSSCYPGEVSSRWDDELFWCWTTFIIYLFLLVLFAMICKLYFKQLFYLLYF